MKKLLKGLQYLHFMPKVPIASYYHFVNIGAIRYSMLWALNEISRPSARYCSHSSSE